LPTLPWDAAEEINGRITAHYDIQHGRYRVLGYGLPMPSRAEYVRLLRERYGVEYQAVAGCIVSTSLMSYVARYNSVSIPAANQKFGHDIFEATYQEAKANWTGKLLDQ